MLVSKVKLLLHSDLENEEIFEVGWFPQHLEAGDKAKAESLRCLEIRIDGLRNNDGLYSDATQTLTEIAWQLCSANLGKAYLVLAEDQLLPKSKVRTYKGLFSNKGQIKRGDNTEWEVELDEGWSFFVGMAPITEANRDESLLLASYFFRAFILFSTEQTISPNGRNFLKSIVPYLDVKGTIWVNYMKLIPGLCRDGLVIISFGYHDTREEYVNLRLFFNREIESLIRKAVNLSIRFAAP